MANTVNVGLTTTTNTFNQWRITDNLMANDVNEIARGNFTKAKGNVIISEGYLRLANSTGGVVLDVADDTNIDGTLTAFNIEVDNSSNHLYVDAGDVHIRRMGSSDLFKVNTNTVFYGANVSITNVASGSLNVNNQRFSINTGIMNVSNTAATARLNVHPNTNFFANINTTGTVNVTNDLFGYNISLTRNVTTGNLLVSGLANVNNANITTAYITSLTVANPIAAPASTDDAGYIVRVNQTTDGDGYFRVKRSVASGNAELYWDDISTKSWRVLVNGALGPIAAGNISADNIAVTRNISTGNISVTQNTSTGNLSVTSNISTGNLSVTTNLSVSGTITGNVGGTMKSSREFLSDVGTVSGAVTVNLSTSNWFKYVLSGNTTFTFSNAPTTGNVFTAQLVVTQGSGGGKTVSWGNTIYWAGGLVPPATTGSAGNTDIWTLTTYDGGSTFIGTLTVKDAR